ncbi:MAG: DMT family transporter [Cytophagales bacterium]|nr:DMT family transporter [Cytophagales bacterium]
MNQYVLLLMSIIVGIMVVIQGGLNARLGVILKSPLLATSAALSVSALITITAVLLTVKQFPSLQQLRSVPTYLWFTGAVFSFLAVTLFYYLIPRLGISTAVSFGLFGQIMFSVMAAHYGWFSMPQEPIIWKKAVGILSMIAGLYLIKF